MNSIKIVLTQFQDIVKLYKETNQLHISEFLNDKTLGLDETFLEKFSHNCN